MIPLCMRHVLKVEWGRYAALLVFMVGFQESQQLELDITTGRSIHTVICWLMVAVDARWSAMEPDGLCY